MTDQVTIKRRPDGSIDTAFYQGLGRDRRSQAFTLNARQLSGLLKRAVVGARHYAVFSILTGSPVLAPPASRHL